MNEEVSITVFDCTNKKAVRVYKSITLAVKHYFPREAKQKSCIRVKYAITHKRKVKSDACDYLIAFRYASQAHKEMLGGNDFIILPQ